MASFQLTKEQAAAVYDRGGGLLVSAAAGSGKTKVLVDRLMAHLTDPENPKDIDRFLIITYTKAAAGELRGKIAEELGRRLADTPRDRHLRRQTTLVYKAEIKTVHGFCSTLIRENAHLLNVSPDFRVADEGEGEVLKRRALDLVMEERYETLPETDAFYRLVDTLSAGRDDARLVEIVLDTHTKLQSHPYPGRWLRARLEELRVDPSADAGETPWGRLLLEDAGRQAAYWRGEMARAGGCIAGDPALAKAYGESFSETIDALDRFARALAKGWDAAAAQGDIPFPRLGSVRNFGDKALLERIKNVRTRCKQRMGKVTGLFADGSRALLSDLAEACPVVEALFSLTEAFDAAYRREKERRILLDFADLEHLAVRALLDEETGAPTELARTLGQRYQEIMVDEYQDTNAVQDLIFTALSREGRNLFMVGDVKQSIYRFRLADPSIFLAKYRTFAPYEAAKPGQPRRILLSRNFRSRKEVLEAVNFLFRNIMSTEFGEMDYTGDEALYPGAEFPQGGDCRVELRVIDLAAPEGEDPEEEPPERAETEARYAASRIDALLREGFSVFDKDLGRLRPCAPGDIVILLRAPGAVLQYYVRALGERGIPCQAEGGEDFLASVEVTVALHFLALLDNARQDVPLVSVLRSPVFGFSPDALAEIRAAAPEEDFYGALEAAAGTREDCRAFLEELAALRSRAPDLRTDGLIWQLYNRFNLLGVFGALPGGEGRQANLIMLYEHARRFERAGHRGLFAFMNYVGRLRETGRGLAPPNKQGGGDAVRIMSIHKSKGLEFPVVLLMGLSKPFNRADLIKPILVHPRLGVGPRLVDPERMVEYPTLPRRAVERQLDLEMRAEELRLLYVAMTRAKEKLILCCTLPNAAAALGKLAMDSRCPMEPQVLAAAPSMAGWILPAAMARPDGAPLRSAAGVPLEEYGGDPGPAWDMAVVDGRGLAGPERVRRDAPAAPKPEGEPEVAPQALFFRYPHRAAADLPSKLTATELKGRQLDREAAEDAPQPFRKHVFHRPRFAALARGLTAAERGTALHLAMQHIRFHRTGSPEAVAAELSRMEKTGLLTPGQAKAASPEKIAALFASPLGARLRAAGALHREFKFSILVPAEDYFPEAAGETVLLQGVVDCWLEEPEGLAVVDFKTDRIAPGQEAERAQVYRNQLEAYGRALGELTGKPVIEKLLYFFETDTAVALEEI